MARAVSYRDLLVWQRAMDLFDALYEISESWPKRELFGMTQQLRRAALSVPSNIAEGQGRRGPREFLHHLSIANGSLCEIETCVIAAHRRGYIDNSDLALLLLRSDEIGRMMQAMRTGLEANINRHSRSDRLTTND
ncbi:MAG TPA: four helix bundle protein [Thermomicrobiales bacterium]|nr:four helix bundle protein [Thermomicrobiales bacterium]